MLRKGDLTQGGITGTLLHFTLPMLVGSFLQQCYNIADTLIVGQCIGAGALAAVGSAYTLMVFLISVLLGLAMGSGTVFSLHYGAGNHVALRRSIFSSFVLIGIVTLILNVAVFIWLDPILRLLQVPQDIYGMMRSYLWIIFCGIVFTFIYNFYASLLRAVGDSVTPLWFLAVSVVLNIALDLFFILQLDWGIQGAAAATVLAQGVAALGIIIYTYRRRPELRWHHEDMCFDRTCLKEIASFSTLTCIQQSVMNLGILMVQGLVNSFGTAVMAAFAAAVKIDSFAYMPVQEFGNAFSTFIAQNFGAGRYDRIHRGVRVCRATDAYLCPSGRDGDYCGGNGVPTHRRCFLLWHRHLVFAVRILPGHPYAGHVCCADCAVAGYPCRSFLLAGLDARGWGDGHLVVHPHRLADCRRSRYLVLSVC